MTSLPAEALRHLSVLERLRSLNALVRGTKPSVVRGRFPLWFGFPWIIISKQSEDGGQFGVHRGK
jgi:hypothetical protein